jgi:subtilisin family serine protease
VANTDIPWQGADVVGSSFGDSVQLLEALVYIFQNAGTAPCVVNVSLGTNGGPHDGTTLVEQGIDRLLIQAPDRAVCIAASNSFADGIHAAGTVPASGAHDLAWLIAPSDQTENELELWYDGDRRLSVELIRPDGQSVGTLAPGQSGTASQNGQVVLFAANRLGDPNNGDNTIGLFLSPIVPPGRWLLRLTSADGTEVPFHAWAERDDTGQSTFDQPLDNTRTIGSISCGRKSIVVGSYDAHKPATPLSWFSSAGPTRDGREKPEVSAPGHDVVAAAALSKTGTTCKSGTSMASPAVTGCVALLLAEAAARSRSLSIDEIRGIVVDTARSTPPAAGAWHDRYGAGRVTAGGMIARL